MHSVTRPATTRRIWPGIGACVFFAVSLLSAGSLAQAELSTALAEQRMTVLREDGAADDSEIIAVYSEVKKLLIQASSYERETASYIEEMTNAPIREAEIQARMDTQQEDPSPTADLAGLEREQLEARLVIARGERDEAISHLDGVNRRLAARESNADEARQRLSSIQEALNNISKTTLSIEPTAKPSIAEGQDWHGSASYIALNAERRALKARLDSQPARYNAMGVERAEAELQLERLSRIVQNLELHLQGKVQDKVDAQSLGIDPADPVYALATELAEADTELRKERIDVNERLSNARSSTEEINRQSRDLKQRFSTARRIVDFAAESEVLGSLLLAHWEELDNFRIKDPTSNLSREAAGAVVHRIEREESLKTLVSASGFINHRLADADISPESVSKASHDALTDLVHAYRDRLRAIIDSESDYIEALGTLRESYLSYSKLIHEYEAFLKGLILWIPAYPPLWEISENPIPQEVAALRSYARDIRISNWIPLALGIAACLLLYTQRRRLKAKQHALNKLVSRPRDDDIRHTLFAMALVTFRALPIPALLAGLGLALAPENLGQLINTVAAGFFLLVAYRIICEPEGLAEVHFEWSTERTAINYREMRRLIYVWLPVAAITGLIFHTTIGAGEAVLARSGLILLVTLLLAPLISSLLISARQSPGHWLRDGGHQFRLYVIIVLVIIAVAVARGHVYSFTVIFDSLMDTLWIAILLLLLHSLLMRWVRVTRRNLRLAQLLEARTQSEGTAEAMVEESVASVSDVSTETSELINVGTVAVAAICLFYIWSPLLPALDALKDVTLWTSTAIIEGETVENRISLAMLMLVIVLAGLTIFFARKLPALIDLVLRSRTKVSASVRYTVSSLLNYLIIGGGGIAALSALGLQWSELQWLVAALGVGIGFGLQEIIANFISGLIILFERPIRIGDVVSTGENDGTVTRIRIRATTIRDWDGKELLVPNKEFVTGRLLNWSLSDPKVRIILPVGIAYGSDVELAIRTLHEIVEDHPRIVNEPEPQIAFENFGDNALMLSARAYLDSVENRIGVITAINRVIYRRFEELGIVIAFPQRDIHLASGQPIRIALESTREDSGKS